MNIINQFMCSSFGYGFKKMTHPGRFMCHRNNTRPQDPV